MQVQDLWGAFTGGGESQFHDSCTSSTFLAEATNSLLSQYKLGEERHCHSKWSLVLYHIGLGTVISDLRPLLLWEVTRRLCNSRVVGKVMRNSLRFNAGKRQPAKQIKRHVRDEKNMVVSCLCPECPALPCHAACSWDPSPGLRPQQILVRSVLSTAQWGTWVYYRHLQCTGKET